MAKMLRSSIKAVLVDLSGTLHIEDTAIPGAVAALNRLKDGSVKIRFVTNTTKESKHILWQRLVKLGFSLNVDDIFSSLTAARQLIEARKLRPMLLLEPAAMEDYKGITADDPNAVVIGLAPSKFEYQTLTEAFRLLLSGASLIAIHKGRYYRRKDGLALGPGPFVEALEYGSDKKAEIVGKPEKLFFQQALAPLGCKPEEAVMIGDDVCDDIDGAQKAGIIGMLVKTGKYRDGDESKISPAPNYIFDNFPSAVDFILQNINA